MRALCGPHICFSGQDSDRNPPRKTKCGPYMGPMCVVLSNLNRYYSRTTYMGPSWSLCVALGYLNRNHPRTTHVGPIRPHVCFFSCKFQLEIQNWALHWSHMHCSGQSEYISSQNNTYGPLMGTIFVVALCVVLGYLNRSHPRTTHVGPVYVFFFWASFR